MPLKSIRHTVNVPGELDPIVQRRLKELKYRSLSHYFVSLIVYDIWARKQHTLTGQVMNEPAEIQDKVFEELVREFDNPTGKPGSWFEHRIEEIIEGSRKVTDIRDHQKKG